VDHGLRVVRCAGSRRSFAPAEVDGVDRVDNGESQPGKKLLRGDESMKRFRKSEGFTLIELLIVIIIIGILAAIAIPMFLGQRDKAKESAVKEGVHSIQVGVQSYAVDNQDVYPPVASVTSTGLTSYVDNWPDNPWTNTGMDQGAAAWAEGDKGDYYYSLGTDTFSLVGYGKSKAVITVP
jgi:prepilin-type N-terminal cleavage/methylation domain-containing protein